MTRALLIACGVVAAGMMGHPARARAQAPSPVGGVWTLNRGASEFPKEIGFNPAWVTPPTADGQPAASSGGRGRRGSSGGGGNRAPGSPFSTHQASYDPR